MGDNLIFSINVVLPLFLCCVVGYAFRRAGLVDESFLKGCSNVVFYIAIPANIFRSISSNTFSGSFSLPLMIYIFASILLLAAILLLVVPRVVHDRRTAGTIIVAVFRSNFAMLGIPLAISLMGEAGAAPTMVMIPFATLLYTALTVIILAGFGERGAESGKAAVWKVTSEVLKNPLIVASAASILVACLRVELPVFLSSTIDKFADVCTGLALFMLGAQLNLREAAGRLRQTIPIAILRLIVVPTFAVGTAALLGFRNEKLACVFIFFAAPTAVNSYILADRMGGDGKLAADAVLVTSCLSCLTLTAGIFLLKTLQLL